MPKEKRVDKRFWVSLLVILGLSLLIIVLSSVDSITGHAAVQTIGYMERGSELSFEVNNGGIKQATIHIADTIKNGKIFFEEKDDILFDGLSYSKVKISSDHADSIQMDLELKLKEKDLVNLGLKDLNEISAYMDDQEKRLTFIKRENGYVHYSVSLKEFGNFVIGKKKTAPVLIKEASTESFPDKIEAPAAPVIEQKVEAPTAPASPVIEQKDDGLVIEDAEKELNEKESKGGFSFWAFLKGLFS